MPYRLLDAFQNLFDGTKYLHRNASLGDFVALHLYEDLVALDKSSKLVSRVASHEWVLNVANKQQGVKARRGDGTFGELVPSEKALLEPGFVVARGPIATIEIGVEVKILAKAMIKQIDRVIGDLQKQVAQFKRSGTNPICVAVVGINQASYAVGYEGERSFRTDGRSNRHPIQEAAEAERRLRAEAEPHYDEFIVLNYAASNDPPFPFEWKDLALTSQNYGAALLRISRKYDQRF